MVFRSCHEEERKQSFKFRRCEYNGRRLRQAWQIIKKTSDDFLQAATSLALSDCEGDGELHTWLVNSLRHASAYSLTRFKYLNSIPWAFCLADTQESVADCLKQFHSVPSESHDSMSVDIFDELGQDIQVVADGGKASEAF